jgi:hypothetical protein
MSPASRPILGVERAAVHDQTDEMLVVLVRE